MLARKVTRRHKFISANHALVWSTTVLLLNTKEGIHKNRNPRYIRKGYIYFPRCCYMVNTSIWKIQFKLLNEIILVLMHERIFFINLCILYMVHLKYEHTEWQIALTVIVLGEVYSMFKLMLMLSFAFG